MFILILFGYKQTRVFTIDCLTASLIDCIWTNCIKDMQKLINTKEDLLFKEVSSQQKKLAKNQTQLEQVQKQIKEEEEKKQKEQQAQQATQDQNRLGTGQAGDKDKKDAKKPTKVVDPKKKGGKGGQEEEVQNPLEKEKLDLTTEIEKLKEIIVKYQDKLSKLKTQKEKYSTYLTNQGNFHIELLDQQGERKFVKTKLDTIANTFLSDKNSYYLSTITQDNEEEKAEVLTLEGYSLRTLEEDEKAGEEEPLFQAVDPKKKDAKKGKKGK